MNSWEVPISNFLSDLQPTSRRLLGLALTAQPVTAPTINPSARLDTERELSRLLCHIEERLNHSETPDKSLTRKQLRLVAEACARVLEHSARSAEVFAQLVERAHRRHDFARLDALGEMLARNFAPSEICEVARHQNPVIRALGIETLVHLPTEKLAQLLADEVDAPVARFALEQKAWEYDSEEAQRLLYWWDEAGGEVGMMS